MATYDYIGHSKHYAFEGDFLITGRRYGEGAAKGELTIRQFRNSTTCSELKETVYALADWSFSEEKNCVRFVCGEGSILSSIMRDYGEEKAEIEKLAEKIAKALPALHKEE